jgi:tetratricopeptide (TPR) repeat protein
LDCGGKRSATPLSQTLEGSKAPSPLRSAGAVRGVTDGFGAWAKFGLALAMLFIAATGAFAAEVRTSDQAGELREKRGEVRYQRSGATETSATPPQKLSDGDSLTTQLYARAAGFFEDGDAWTLGQNTKLVINASAAAAAAIGNPRAPVARLSQGSIYIIHRAGPASTPIETPLIAAVPRGTEFSVTVDAATGESVFTMFDGEVTLRRNGEERRVTSGFQGIVSAGKPIEVRPILQARNLVQWWIYYPGVLDVGELGLAGDTTLTASLEAYRAGDLRLAWQRFPNAAAAGETPARQAYQAALLLGVGDIERAETLIENGSREHPSMRALRTMLDAVAPPLTTNSWRARRPLMPVGDSASELLALSYAQQARHDLEAALRSARASVAKSPQFGFGWARVAELEFSFGHTRAAREAVNKAIHLSPQNAQAHALRGFVLAADNHTVAALASFERAIVLDSALANGWLGRGLVRIRRGDAKAGREDLALAAILEPARSFLRSYAGKAFTDAGDVTHAMQELKQARELDPNDPTPWLYSALLNQQEHRFNEGIADLERSQELNDNRMLYRSRQLLDQDHAVRSANLANIYLEAGMADVSVREAARGVSYDYANYASHLFLADSYDALRDPTRFNLRYETVWFNELLLANLLSPVGAGRLSQGVSAQEYSRLFQADKLSLASSTMARSDGMVRERASQFGTFGSTAYAFDLDYQYHDGVRPNNRLESIEWYTTVKQQFTPQDSALMLVKYEDYQSGDNFQYYDPRQARRHFQFDEKQAPILAGGWHHEWAPGVHTLFLGGRLINEQRFSDRNVPQIILVEDATGKVSSRDTTGVDVNYRNRLEIYSAELNQILDARWFTLSAGARYQAGDFTTANLLNHPTRVPFLLGTPPARGSVDADFERITGYGYLTLKPVDQLRLIGGLAYEEETVPGNFRHPPVTSGDAERSHLGPKAALVWTPLPEATVRGVYTRSLGGVSLDESYRLEPTQLGGFPQAFRTLIPESAPGVGSVSAPEHETFGLALDFKFGTRTYAGVQVERLTSEVRRRIGVFTAQDGTIPATASSIAENLDYAENALTLSVNQLIGDQFTAGAAYKLARAELEDRHPGLRSSVLTAAYPSTSATLHEASGFVLFNHHSGFFARFEVHWYAQQNSGYGGTRPGDDFLQEHIFLGYRFPRGRGDVRFGVLNLGGEDYRLNPLNVYQELPRERVFEARLNFLF